MGQFADFLSEKGLSPDQILRVSRRIESLRDADRALMRKRALKRRTSAGQSYEEANLAKPRSGRPLRPGHLAAATGDQPVPGPVRTKLVRAVNQILQKKGQEPIRHPQLFGNVPSRQGKKPS